MNDEEVDPSAEEQGELVTSTDGVEGDDWAGDDRRAEDDEGEGAEGKDDEAEAEEEEEEEFEDDDEYDNYSELSSGSEVNRTHRQKENPAHSKRNTSSGWHRTTSLILPSPSLQEVEDFEDEILELNLKNFKMPPKVGGWAS